MTTTLTRSYEWDMGHRLPDHDGKCRRLHGHRYRMEVVVAGAVDMVPGRSTTGMVIDFGRLDGLVKPIVAEMDHFTLLWESDPMMPNVELLGVGVIPCAYVPTAENLARDLFRSIASALAMWAKGGTEGERDVRLESVRLWETPTSYVLVTE